MGPVMGPFDSDSVETFGEAGLYEDGAGPIARRLAARKAAEARAIGKPSVFAPIPLIPQSPFTQRAMASQLPAKEYGR